MYDKKIYCKQLTVRGLHGKYGQYEEKYFTKLLQTIPQLKRGILSAPVQIHGFLSGRDKTKAAALIASVPRTMPMSPDLEAARENTFG